MLCMYGVDARVPVGGKGRQGRWRSCLHGTAETRARLPFDVGYAAWAGLGHGLTRLPESACDAA